MKLTDKEGDVNMRDLTPTESLKAAEKVLNRAGVYALNPVNFQDLYDVYDDLPIFVALVDLIKPGTESYVIKMDVLVFANAGTIKKSVEEGEFTFIANSLVKGLHKEHGRSTSLEEIITLLMNHFGMSERKGLYLKALIYLGIAVASVDPEIAK
ncbi:hypothetical protein ACFL24_00695 [Patescibacteria group bacterium]